MQNVHRGTLVHNRSALRSTCAFVQAYACMC